MPRSKTPTSNFPSGSTNADSGELRHWQTKSGDTAFEAELKQVERSTAILKKKEDGQIVKIAFDNLCDGDQEAVSDWTLRELNRIWENGTEKIGPRESCESVKAREMAKALDGACVHTVFSIDQAPSTEQEQTLTKLRLSGAWDSKLKEIVLPLSQSLSAKVSQDAQLVVLGRLNIKYAACPLCGGTGMLKCPDCVHGQRYHMESKPIVFPSGERVMQSVKVSVRCQTCGGSGRHGVCRQHDLQAWEPFGTRKLPQGSFFTLTDSGGARRVCIALDEPCIQIHVTANVITFRRAEGKLDIQTTAAGKIP